MEEIYYPIVDLSCHSIVLEFDGQSPMWHLVKHLGKVHDYNICLFAKFQIFEDVLGKCYKLWFRWSLASEDML